MMKFRLTEIIIFLILAYSNLPSCGAIYESVCVQLANAISPASNVYFPYTLQWTADNEHWAASSIQNSTCSVEPGTVADIGVILQILGSSGTPFAVKGGGHTSNPGFSSTLGVQIAMSRFSEITYNENASTVDIGAGLIWDDVYAALEPYNVNVVGGRVTGIGVAGFTLGGGKSMTTCERLHLIVQSSLGYSFKTNQYGLTIDTVQAFEIVLANGAVLSATATAYPDLFFALKGGSNNFGIVTKFTLSAYPQTQVWGGLITIAEAEIPQLIEATANFSATVVDPKASILPTINYFLGEPSVSLILFYDAPTPPSGIFDEFLDIPYSTKDIQTRNFLDLVLATPSNGTEGFRGYFNTVSLVKYTESLLNVIYNETQYWGAQISLLDSSSFISYDIEPFLPSLFSHGSSSAYPPNRSVGFIPLNLYFAFVLPEADTSIQNALKESAATITNAAITEGQDIANAALYGNYALFDTSIEAIYGANIPRLESIKAEYDPDNVMGLAGGFKISVA